MADSGKKYLSIVIPAYNEEFRLPKTLELVFNYFEKADYSYEVIVVDDGSVDNTSQIVRENFNFPDKLKLISQKSNHGKGFAVSTGIKEAIGEYIIFCDADGATPIEEIEKLLKSIASGVDIAIGSRGLKQSNVNDLWHRRLRGKVFNFLIKIIVISDFNDTQCGFKLFKADCAKKIFSKLILIGFSFDVEVLFLAKKMGYSVSEVPIRWNAIPGTKLNPFVDPFLMLLAILKIKFMEIMGKYKI